MKTILCETCGAPLQDERRCAYCGSDAIRPDLDYRDRTLSVVEAVNAPLVISLERETKVLRNELEGFSKEELALQAEIVRTRRKALLFATIVGLLVLPLVWGNGPGIAILLSAFVGWAIHRTVVRRGQSFVTKLERTRQTMAETINRLAEVESTIGQVRLSLRPLSTTNR